MKQNYLDCNLDHHLDREIIFLCKHSIWIEIWIIFIQVLGGLRCYNDRTMNNNVNPFKRVHLLDRNLEHDQDCDPDYDLDNFASCKRVKKVYE